MANPILSILICTIDGREAEFDRLYKLLNVQIQSKYDSIVEILYIKDNREMKVGTKRNQLMLKANGQFIVYVDDDDLVSDQYINRIIPILNNNSNIDCIGIKGIITENNNNPKVFIHSNKYNTYFELNKTYYRPPNHLNPIRKSIAIEFPFIEINKGEDTDWAMRLCNSRRLKNEVMIDDVLYHYLYSSHRTATQFNPNPNPNLSKPGIIKPPTAIRVIPPLVRPPTSIKPYKLPPRRRLGP